jgi:hypothetical protein
MFFFWRDFGVCFKVVFWRGTKALGHRASKLTLAFAGW